MNILVFSQYFYPETFRVNNLCAELVKRGHKVTVLTAYPQYPQGKIYEGYGFNKPYESKWNGVKIERVKTLPRGKTPIGLLLNCITYVWSAKKWVKKTNKRFDAVYVFEVSPVTVGLPAVAYKKKFGTPIFFNVQDLWPENVEIVLGIRNKIVIGIINKIADKIYNASDKILCASNGFVENIASRGVPREKLVFWPQFCTEPDLNNSKAPEIYNKHNFNIVFTGNIGFAQGLELLIDAAEKLKGTTVKWYLVGDGRAKEHLKKMVTEKELEEQVIFVDKVSEQEANRYIHFADCAYLSFKNNKLFDMTIPAKLQSYLACGTPVLAAASGESKEIVEKVKCGLACSPDKDSLVLKVEELLQNKNMQQYRKNARAYYEEEFTLEKQVNRLEGIINESFTN